MNPVNMRSTLLKCCIGLALATSLAACGSDSATPATSSTTTTTPTTTTTTTTTPTPTTGVSFLATIQPIFTAHCVSCHQVGGQGSLLVLNSGTYSNLVNRPSAVLVNSPAGPISSGTLVIPGDSFNSVLVKRITGDLIGGLQPLLQMPLGGPFLSADEQNLIKSWIDQGAKNN